MLWLIYVPLFYTYRYGFSKAVLLHVNLRNADLREVDLSQARLLTQEQIDQACVDESTKLPSGLRKPPPCPDIKGNN